MHVSYDGVNWLYCCKVYKRFDGCDVFISALEIFNFLFYTLCYLCTLPLAPKVHAASFGWGVRSHFSHWVFGFLYQVVHRLVVRVVYLDYLFEKCT